MFVWTIYNKRTRCMHVFIVRCGEAPRHARRAFQLLDLLLHGLHNQNWELLHPRFIWSNSWKSGKICSHKANKVVNPWYIPCKTALRLQSWVWWGETGLVLDFVLIRTCSSTNHGFEASNIWLSPNKTLTLSNIDLNILLVPGIPRYQDTRLWASHGERTDENEVKD